MNSIGITGALPGSRLAIVGNGFMGVLHARAAKALEYDVTLVETHRAPTGLARAWRGAAIERDAELARQSAYSVDVTIFIRDAADNLDLAGELTRSGGVVSVFASLPLETTIGLPARL